MQSFDRQKITQLLVGIAGVYSIYSITGLLQESVIKSKYVNDVTGEKENLEYPYVQLMFVGFFSYVLGELYNRVTLEKKERVSIPWYHGVKCGGSVVLITICYSYAIKFTNFPVVMMIRSCSLLSVVIVGVMFSGVSDVTLKLGGQKLLVACVVTVGMIVFKVFDPNQKEDDKSTELIGVVLMVFSLIGEGLLPDFQAIIKQDYKPLPTVLLTFVNKWTTIITIGYSILMGHFPHILSFILHHKAILVDNVLIGVLCFIGQLFIYRMVKQFKQHIVPFVITTRKIFTVALSIIVYGHMINKEQMVGVAIVFGASFWEFVTSVRKDYGKGVRISGQEKEKVDETEKGDGKQGKKD